MRNDKLSNQSLDFAVSIINLVKELKTKHESVIANQIGRSGTSIGANIREAQYAHGTADFKNILCLVSKITYVIGLRLLMRTMPDLCQVFFMTTASMVSATSSQASAHSSSFE